MPFRDCRRQSSFDASVAALTRPARQIVVMSHAEDNCCGRLAAQLPQVTRRQLLCCRLQESHWWRKFDLILAKVVRRLLPSNKKLARLYNTNTSAKP